MNKMKQALSLLLALLMVAVLIPMGAVSVAADSTAVDISFEDGKVTFSSGSPIAIANDGDNYLTFDAKGADWANIYYYTNAIKANTNYKVTFAAKADKECTMNFKINDNWQGDTCAETVNLTTEWANYELEINSGALTSVALVLFSSDYPASDAPVYSIDDVKLVELVNPAEIGVVVNGNFEDGANGWKLGGGASVVDGALKLDNPSAWSEAAVQMVPVKPDTDYVITWDSKRVSGSGAFHLFPLQAESPYANFTKLEGQNWMNETSGNWVNNAYTVNSGEYAVMMIKLCADDTANPGVILIDNIRLSELKEPEVAGGVVNGDFETGTIDGWEKWQQTIVSAEAAHSGSFGAHLKGNGSWGGMLNQNFTVEDGKNYELSFWYKVNQNGVNAQFTGVDSAVMYASGWLTAGEWTRFSETITVAGDTQIKLNFCGGGNGVGEDVYIDDVQLNEVKTASDDGFILNGDFETGTDINWTMYSGTAVSAEAAYEGNYGVHIKNSTGGWGGTLFQDFAIEVGKKYVVNLWAKAIAGGQNIQIQNSGATVASTWFTGTEWTCLSFEFEAISTEARINICGGGTNANEEIFVDSIEVVQLKEPYFDGFVTNGDFEAGSLTGFDKYQQTALSKAAAKNGTYGAQLLGAGTWGALLEQKVQNLVAGQAYTITFWAKANTSGTNWTLKQNDVILMAVDGENKASGYLSATEWTEVSVSFIAVENGEALLNFCGAGTGEAEDIYLDDIVIVETELPDVPDIPDVPTCQHEYDNACDASCNLCGETRQVGDHVYTYPCDQSCDICGASREADHEWTPATCTAPRICSVCGSEDGEALGHAWIDATCTEPKTCKVCGITEDGVLGHSYANACDADCDVCGESREVNGHSWAEGTCSICGETSPSKVTITKEPSTGYAQMGNKVSVKVTAEGEGLKYEWYIKNNGSKKYSKSSVTKSTYSTTMNEKAKDRLVFCRIYDQYGNMVQCKTVRLREAVSLTSQPSASAIYAQSGKKATIKITASGDGLTYTWYIKNDGSSKYSKSSVTSATYSATMSSKVKGRRVYCVVTDKYGKTVQTKTFILRESVSITTQPKTVTVAKNKTAKITVKASGDGLKYTWYIKNAGASKYTKSSVTTSSYSAKMTNSSKNRLVYCVVTDKYGNTVKTVTVKLKMK